MKPYRNKHCFIILLIPLFLLIVSSTPKTKPSNAKDLTTFIIRNIMLKTINDPKADENLTIQALKEFFQIQFTDKNCDTDLNFKKIFDELLLYHHHFNIEDYQIYKKMSSNVLKNSDDDGYHAQQAQIQLTDSTPYYGDSIWSFLKDKNEDYSHILDSKFWDATMSGQQQLNEYISTQTIQSSQDVKTLYGQDVIMRDGKAFMYGGTVESITKENCYILQLDKVDSQTHGSIKSLISKLNGEIRWSQEEDSHGGLISYKACFPEGQLPLTLLKALKPILMVERDQKVQSSVRPSQYLQKKYKNAHPSLPYNVQEQAPWHLIQLSNTTNNAIELDDSIGFAYNNTGEGVTIYTIDSGISPDHQEFEGRASLGWSVFPSEFPSDCVGHGTQVGSVIVGKTVGVAKRAKIVAVQVLGCNGEGQNSGVLEGLNWTIKNAKRPAVINMSIGGPKSPSIDEAVKKAINDGIAVVVAAGNNNDDACLSSPSGIKEAMVVGASTREGERAHFSNWGKCVDIFAPGRFVISASIAGRGSINKNNPQAGYGLASGTSLAAPLVAGIMALMLAEDTNLSPEQLNKLIVNHGRSGHIKGASISKDSKIVALRSGSPNILAQTPLIRKGDGHVIHSFLQPNQLPFVPWGISNNGTSNTPPPKSDENTDEEHWGLGDYAIIGIGIALIVVVLIILLIGTKRLISWRNNRLERERIEREILESGGHIIEDPLHHAVINDVLNAEKMMKEQDEDNL